MITRNFAIKYIIDLNIYFLCPKGYICDANGSIGSEVANVMCKSLGFQYGRSLPNFGFVQTNLRLSELVYVFDSIDCHGDETSVFDCQLGTWRLE